MNAWDRFIKNVPGEAGGLIIQHPLPLYLFIVSYAFIWYLSLQISHHVEDIISRDGLLV